MTEHFQLADTLRNLVELMKSVVKEENEDPKHFLIRARHIAETVKKMTTEECARTIFLAGFTDHDTEYCYENFIGDLDVLADLLRLSNSANCDVVEQASNFSASENFELMPESDTLMDQIDLSNRVC